MKSSKKLVAFMKAKQKRLSELGVPDDMFFNEKDERWVLDNINEMRASLMWKTICRSIAEGKAGLSKDLCPYCLDFTSPDCNGCPYMANHGWCKGNPISKKSDYRDIISIITARFRALENPVSKLLSNEFYKDVVKNIEKAI